MWKSKGKRRTKLGLRCYQLRNEVGYKMQNKHAENKRSPKQNKSKMTDDVAVWCNMTGGIYHPM